MKILQYLSRYIFGLVFIFSGYVKAVDPLGSMYKLQDYFEAFSMPWLDNLAFIFGALLYIIEFLIGICLIMGVWHRLTLKLATLFMVFFTILTFYLAIYNPVSDCGCFGDAFIMTNWETFYKNLVLMVFIGILWLTINKPFPVFCRKVQGGIFIFATLVIIGVSTYAYRHLPQIDFRPWKIGNRLTDYMQGEAEVSLMKYTYKNKNTKEEKVFDVKNIPWKDTVWVANWEYVSYTKEITKPFVEAPIHDFTIYAENGDEKTDEILFNNGFQFLFIAYDLSKTNKEVFKKASSFIQHCDENAISFVGLTGSSFEDASVFRHSVQAMFPFYNVDATALKTVIRSNPGLVLLKDGVVIGKWHFNDFPDYTKCSHLHK